MIEGLKSLHVAAASNLTTRSAEPIRTMVFRFEDSYADAGGNAQRFDISLAP